jgi:leucyl-tRNA synthetase
MTYGTGAIMAVPGHDERDWEFAKEFGLPIREVVSGGDVREAAFVETEEGTIVNSTSPDGAFSIDGLKPVDAIPKITEWLHARGVGQRTINYKLRDWLFSRQRYWGEPFPIVWVDGEHRALPEQMLPVVLPETKNFKPSGTGESPLANNTEWLTITDPTSGKPGRRETNTMPQWAGSCWYYLRFIDPKNATQLVDPALEKYWMPVDLYVGGSEHAVLHLLYARFWHKVLYDIGVVSTPEPFGKLVHQGMILGEDNRKMSKRWGNVVDPNDMIDAYGADALRVYEMFMGPLEAMKPWSSKSVEGITRFLDRVWRLYVNEDGSLTVNTIAMTPATERVLHQTIRKVGEDVEALKFNTAIAQMMVFVNEVNPVSERPRTLLEPFILLLAPFAPHLAEELWLRLGHKNTLAYEPFPAFDPALCIEDTATVAVQVNGKLRATIEVPRGAEQAAVQEQAFADERIKKYVEGAQIKKVIYVKEKLLNVVVAAQG